MPYATPPPTAYILTPDGFRAVQERDYRYPDWLELHEVDWDAEPMRPETESMLPLVATVLLRLVPGVPVHVLPGLVGRNAFAVYGGRGIGLSGHLKPWEMLDAALHEAWHALEWHLSPADYRLTRRAIERGLPLPEGYYNDPVERSARSFAAWALYQLSRSWNPDLPLQPAKARRTVEHVYADALAGRISLQPGGRLVQVVAANDAMPAGSVSRSPRRITVAQATPSAHWLASLVHRLVGDYATNRRTA